MCGSLPFFSTNFMRQSAGNPSDLYATSIGRVSFPKQTNTPRCATMRWLLCDPYNAIGNGFIVVTFPTGLYAVAFGSSVVSTDPGKLLRSTERLFHCSGLSSQMHASPPKTGRPLLPILCGAWVTAKKRAISGLSDQSRSLVGTP